MSSLPAASLDAGLHALLDTYRAAILAKDLDAFTALYDPHVRVFELWGTWQFDDAAAWRDGIAGWFASLGEERVRVGFDDVRIEADGSLAALACFVSYTAIAPDDRTLRSMTNRLGWTLRRGDAGWRVVHEHTSAPVDVDTGKVKLER